MAFTRSELESITAPWYQKFITENIYEMNVLLDKIKKQDHVIVDGGTHILCPVNTDSLDDATSVDPDDARETPHKETVNSAKFDWKYNKVDLSINWKERVQNSGKPKMADLAAHKLEEGMNDLNKWISTMFYQAYADIGANDFDSLFSAIRTAGTSYGGLSPTDFTDWEAGLVDIATTTLALYGTGSLDYGIRQTWFRDRVDLIVTTRAIASIYASKLQPGERRQPEDGRAGATDLYVQGIPMISDSQCPTSNIIFINTKNLYFFVHPDDNFSASGWEDNPDGFKALRQLITVVGNLGCSARRTLGAYTAITS